MGIQWLGIETGYMGTPIQWLGMEPGYMGDTYTVAWNGAWVPGGHLYSGLEWSLGTWGTPKQWLGMELGYTGDTYNDLELRLGTWGAQLLMHAQVLGTLLNICKQG